MGTIEKQLQALVDLAEGDEGPGAILGIAAPHLGVDWKGASGAFKRGGRKRLKATDGFRIASMSKTFTATLVMQLVERGKLSLDARLGDFFPKDFVRRVHPRASAITLAHLLNHTAGLWDFALSEEWGRELLGEPGVFRHPDVILDWAISHGAPAGEVGAGHVYSDTGYVILGHVLQRVTGVAYKTLCRRRIFKPLAMEQTWLEGHEEPTNVSVTFVFGPLGWAATQRKRRLGRRRARIDGGGPCSIHARPVSRCRAGFAVESRSNAGNGTDAEPSIRPRRRHPP